MRRVFSKTAGFALLVLAAWVSWTSIKVRNQSLRDEARPADVILVLGAAEYSGRPSPIFKARLDHAYELFEKNLSPRILTTGGAGGDPIHTEGGVGRSYLIGRGVPSEAIIVEGEADTTVHTTAAATEIMRRMGLHSCIVVSDGYHVYRVKKMLQSRGLEAYGSPRPWAPKGSLREWWMFVRQSIGHLLWSIGMPV
ncbi:MAG: YdcF family protein [Bryobacteraceae bacterium]